MHTAVTPLRSRNFLSGSRESACCIMRPHILQKASLAKEAGVGRLIVGHYSSRFPSVDFYLDELREIFPESYLAKDGDVVEIPYLRRI